MTLQSSGEISLSDIAGELEDETRPFYMGDADPRALAGIPTGDIYITDFYGASWTAEGYSELPISTLGSGELTWTTLFSKTIVSNSITLDSTSNSIGHSTGPDGWGNYTTPTLQILINGSVVFSRSSNSSISASNIVLYASDTDDSVAILARWYSGRYATYREVGYDSEDGSSDWERTDHGYTLSSGGIYLSYITPGGGGYSTETDYRANLSTTTSRIGNNNKTYTVLSTTYNGKYIKLLNGYVGVGYTNYGHGSKVRTNPYLIIYLDGVEVYRRTSSSSGAIPEIVLRDDDTPGDISVRATWYSGRIDVYDEERSDDENGGTENFTYLAPFYVASGLSHLTFTVKK